MAASIDKTGLSIGWATIRDEPMSEGSGDLDGRLSSTRSVAAAAIAGAAVALIAAPIVLSVLALLMPAALDRAAEWMVGVTLAFSIVAAGRVPAAALLIALTARR